MAIVDGLITLADARASLNFAPTLTQYDTDLERYVEACTPVIENITGPILVKSRTFTLDGGRGAVLLPVKVSSVTSLTESGVVTTDFTADLDAGIIYAGGFATPRMFAPGVQNIVVVVSVGSATIPTNVVLATRELVRHLWQIGRQGSQFPGAQGQSDLPIVPSGFAVPRRVIELLQASPNVGGFA